VRLTDSMKEIYNLFCFCAGPFCYHEILHLEIVCSHCSVFTWNLNIHCYVVLYLVHIINKVWKCCFVLFLVNDWCEFDSGPNSFTDNHGQTHRIHVSRTRDGSVWVRAGQNHSMMDWTLTHQQRLKVQTSLLDDVIITLFQQLPSVSLVNTSNAMHGGRGVNYCVLTDVKLEMNIEASWNPSFLIVYDPLERVTR